MRGFCVISIAASLCAAACAQPTADELIQAIRQNDLASLKSSLAKGAAVDTRDQRGTTLLMHAAAVGSPEAVKLLLEKGADVNARNELEATRLILAAGQRRKGADAGGKGRRRQRPEQARPHAADHRGGMRRLCAHREAAARQGGRPERQGQAGQRGIPRRRRRPTTWTASNCCSPKARVRMFPIARVTRHSPGRRAIATSKASSCFFRKAPTSTHPTPPAAKSSSVRFNSSS